MAKARSFTFNTGPQYPGLTQVGNIAVSSVGQSNLPGGTKWWNGPDENRLCYLWR
jgi:hypothetical protein